MQTSIVAFAIVGLLVGAPSRTPSGWLGIYGIVEKVVIEPNEQAPERIQVWGAFAYVEGRPGPGLGLTVSAAKRGYLYFRLPASGAQFVAITNEWRDLKAVAGTGQAIGFGSWGYIGGFEGLQPDRRGDNVPYILEASPGNPLTDLRVRPATEAAAAPALYQTETGIVKLSDTGSHAAIVSRLRDALKR